MTPHFVVYLCEEVCVRECGCWTVSEVWLVERKFTVQYRVRYWLFKIMVILIQMMLLSLKRQCSRILYSVAQDKLSHTIALIVLIGCGNNERDWNSQFSSNVGVFLIPIDNVIYILKEFRLKHAQSITSIFWFAWLHNKSCHKWKIMSLEEQTGSFGQSLLQPESWAPTIICECILLIS